MDKLYSGQIQLGLATDTDDVTGRAMATHDGEWPEAETIRQVLQAREGEGDQLPPAFSAIQVDGKRAHRAARAGQPLDLPLRRVTAHRLELLNYQPPLVDFRAEVSSGYYIRSLARDVGAELGLGGCLSALRREKVGPWSLAGAVTLEELAAWTEEDWAARLAPPAEALPHLPGLPLTATEARGFGQGKKLPVSAGTGQYKILSPSGELLGLGEISSIGGSAPQEPFLRPLRVFPVE
jgi:tRNA pseudouridine55 synthase